MTGEIIPSRRLGDDGEWIITNHYFIDRVEVTAEAFRAAFPEQSGTPHFSTAISAAKPLRSEALAVHPKQIPEVLARNKKHGINVRYDRHGRPVFTDAGQRRALMKLEKVRSMNSAYGY